MAIGPVQLLVLGFSRPDFHGDVLDSFISPLDLVAIGLLTAVEAEQMQALERAAGADPSPASGPDHGAGPTAATGTRAGRRRGGAS